MLQLSLPCATTLYCSSSPHFAAKLDLNLDGTGQSNIDTGIGKSICWVRVMAKVKVEMDVWAGVCKDFVQIYDIFSCVLCYRVCFC